MVDLSGLHCIVLHETIFFSQKPLFRFRLIRVMVNTFIDERWRLRREWSSKWILKRLVIMLTGFSWIKSSARVLDVGTLLEKVDTGIIYYFCSACEWECQSWFGASGGLCQGELPLPFFTLVVDIACRLITITKDYILVEGFQFGRDRQDWLNFSLHIKKINSLSAPFLSCLSVFLSMLPILMWDVELWPNNSFFF